MQDIYGIIKTIIVMIIIIDLGGDIMNQCTKYSRQREALLTLLQSTQSHPTAEWLYTELKKSFPKISLATVYRNLNLLVNAGEIIRLDIGTGTEHFDAATKNHYHFICRRCQSILDLDLPPMVQLNYAAEKNNSVQVEKHTLLFYGVCKNCQ